MASKRNLKKSINYLCSEVFAECVAVSAYSHADKSDADSLLRSILQIHSHYILRVSHPEPGMRAKKYYADLIDRFNAEISELVDHIGNL